MQVKADGSKHDLVGSDLHCPILRPDSLVVWRLSRGLLPIAWQDDLQGGQPCRSETPSAAGATQHSIAPQTTEAPNPFMQGVPCCEAAERSSTPHNQHLHHIKIASW